MFRTDHRHSASVHLLWLILAIVGVSFAAATSVAAAALLSPDEDPEAPPVLRILPPTREKPQPGSIRLRNGLIVSGMCSRASTLAPLRRDMNPGDRRDQRLEMRLVDQKAREIYLPVRRSELPALDNTVWPSVTFSIPQKRISRKAMPTGVPSLGPFNSEGIAVGKLFRPNGKEEDIQVGIVAINELYAEVQSLTHDWSYHVAFDAVPRESLTMILGRTEGFAEKPFVRLDVVRMLIRANRLPEAAVLFDSVRENIPELGATQQEYQQQIREQLARQITAALEERRDVGQHGLAARGAQVHPKENLTPETVVRVSQLIDHYADINQRMENVRSLLPALVAEIEDPRLHDEATRISRLVTAGINPDTIDRFATFELTASPAAERPRNDPKAENAAAEPVAADKAAVDGAAVDGAAVDGAAVDGAAVDGAVAENEVNDIRPEPDAGRLPPEQQLAIAYSGWLLGAGNTVRNLGDVVSLFDARELILDYLNAEPSEQESRRLLIERIVRLEGVSIERIAAMVRNLPAVQTPYIEFADAGSSGRFTLSATADSMAGSGLVPPEYHDSRPYPVVIAMHGHFDSPESYLDWWQAQAQKHGFIVVAPDWSSLSTAADINVARSYDGSAETHRLFLGFVRKLKHSLRCDDDRIFIAGQDLGGDVAMDMAASHPDLFAGVISICGAGRRHLQWTASNAIQLPWYVVVGDSQGDWFDRMGTLAARLFKRDDEMRIDFDTVFVKYPFRGLERYTEECDDVFAWMTLHRRDPYPSRVYAKLLRSSDLHWSWAELKSLPSQFGQLDAPHNGTDGTYRPAELNIRLDDSNLIRIQSAPADLTLRLSPAMPGLDMNGPIRIHNGRRTMNILYKPEITHLLEELYSTGDRSRLCFMKVDVSK